MSMCGGSRFPITTMQYLTRDITILVIFESSNRKFRKNMTEGAVKCVVLVLGNIFPHFGMVVKSVVFYGVCFVPHDGIGL